MRRSFWHAAMISLAAYAAAILIGLWAGFQFTLLIVPVFQVTWTLFCVIRLFQLRRAGGHKPDAPEEERESYGFALGGSVSSTVLFLMLLVLTQIV